MKRLILVHGDKGGTGKSHVAHLTAAAFRSAGHPLLLVDGDAKNAGLHRALNGKPDDVLRINARQAHGSDQLLEAFLEAETDVLIDLPAGEPPRLYRRTKLSEDCPLWNMHKRRRRRSRIHPSSANARCGFCWNTAMSIKAKLRRWWRLQVNWVVRRIAFAFGCVRPSVMVANGQV